jgi:hypothetical protein
VRGNLAIQPFDLTQRIINQVCVHMVFEIGPVMSDERTIVKAVGVSLTAIFVVVMILSAISY